MLSVLKLGIVLHLTDFVVGYENLALKKPATQSSNFTTNHLASAAVNGNKGQLYGTGNCAVAAPRNSNTWSVDLGKILSVYKIEIYYRFERQQDWDSQFKGRFAGFSLYISNTINKEEGHLCWNNTQPPTPIMKITCISHGRYIIFYNERKNGVKYPTYYSSSIYNELCEVEVHGCPIPGFYGETCNIPCPYNCKLCNIVNGMCIRCVDGYQGSLCDKPCNEYFYGPNCALRCGNCLNEEQCNNVTGICPNGCATGWRGDQCDIECENGKFGLNCSESCDRCNNGIGRLCNSTTGECTNGCKPGWQDSKCDSACNDFVYGENCSMQCGHCRDGEKCHHINGSCENGCDAGWKGDNCHSECDQGMFGSDCNNKCSINCYINTNRTCHHVTGRCTSGCNPGWEGEKCNAECSGSMYGQQCQMKCGHCIDGDKCHHINGSCTNGCSPGWQGFSCNDTCGETFYGENCMFNCSLDCANRTCNAITGDCSVLTKILVHNDSNGATVAGGIVGGLVVIIALVVFGVIFFRRYRVKKLLQHPEQMVTETACEDRRITNSNTKSLQKDFSNIYVNVSREDSSDIEVVTGQEGDEDLKDEVAENIYANTVSKLDSFQDISIDFLEKLIKKKRVNDDEGFESEYKSLPFGEILPCDAGKMEKNIKKNRFKKTFPYDHSRIILKTDSRYTEDYINANYISDVENEKVYIAAQGPKANTVEDFWRMIWQENASQIVMLTNLEEGPKIKCVQYWPKENDDFAVGPFKLRMTEKKEFAYFTQKSRTITHYHYTAWPDHGIPDPLCLVVFHNYVISTATYDNVPIVVHCSAGVGRTGTYIAVDALYKTGLKTGKVNIPQYVMTMRKNRMNMVQTKEQYITIFLALCEAFKASAKPIRVAEFIAHFDSLTEDVPINQSVLMNEFKTLLKIRPKYTDADFKMALQNNFSGENRSILPPDRFVLYLTTSVPNRGSYINAITVPSFASLTSFIITPYPTHDEVVDLLRLLTDHESNTIVLMDPVSEIKSSDSWLPLHEFDKTDVGPYGLKLESTSIKDNIETRVVLLSNKKTDNKPVQLSFISPKIGISVGKGKDTSVLRELVSTAMNSRQEPVAVISSDGASLCGLFCAIYSAIQQINLDGIVDIFTILRQLQVRRPEFCSSMDEFQMCYQAISDHIMFASENVYYNN